MKKLFAAALFTAAVVAGSGAANALPMAPVNSGDSVGVIEIAQGCGPGFARGPMGRCRPMGYGRPAFVRPPVVVVRPGRVCPRGFAFRFGRCRPF